MRYRVLGKTGLKVSEIGFGGEWLERHDEAEAVELLRYAGEKGINIIDCWMPDPKSRDIIGKGMEGNRGNWIVQGHIGSTYQNGQYVRTRDLKYVIPAFEDILRRMKTDYIDLGMIHYIDAQEEWDVCMNTDYIKYVHKLHDEGTIRHIGLSTHNPRIAKQAVESGFIEMILFSINPAFDMRPATAGSPVSSLRREECRHDGHEGILWRQAVRCKDVSLRSGVYSAAVHSLCADKTGSIIHTLRV